MFSKLRKQTVRIVYAVGVDADGARHYAPVAIFGLGARSFNQVRRQLNAAVKRGRAEDYAGDLARKFAASPGHGHIVRVDVLRGTFDLDACMLGKQVRSSSDVELASVSVAEATAAAPHTEGSLGLTEDTQAEPLLTAPGNEASA
jgi:hypothetical protein